MDPRSRWVSAAAVDIDALDGRQLADIRHFLEQTPGTRTRFRAGKLTEEDQSQFLRARTDALGLKDVPDGQFRAKLRAYVHQCAATKGGRAFLAEVVLSNLEMNVPGALPHLSQEVAANREEYAFTTRDGVSVSEIQTIELRAADQSVFAMAELAARDPVRPCVFPSPAGGTAHDPFIVYDASQRLHVFFQHNPFSEHWSHMHWGHVMLDRGVLSRRPVALGPRPESGYHHVFSGSLLAGVPDPEFPGARVTAAFFTPSGPGKDLSYHGAPPNRVAISRDPTLDTWEPRRYQVTDGDTYRGKLDRIRGEPIRDRYDMRDPVVFSRDGKYFMLVAGTAVPGRVGGGVIALLEPTDPRNLTQPWRYVGDTFRHPQWTLASGGPGILETPSLVRVGDKDVLLFSAQRKPDQGPLWRLDHHQGIQYFTGRFDSSSGEFKPDSQAPSYFEYGRSVYALNAIPKAGVPGEATLVTAILGFGDLPGRREQRHGWDGAVSLPSTLRWVDGKLQAVPDEILQQRRGRSWLSEASLAVSPDAPVRTSIHERTLDIRTRVTLAPETTSATISVLTRSDGSGGVPVVYDGRELNVLGEKIPLSSEKTPSLDLEVVVDRSVLAIYAGGKVLHKVVAPPLQPDGSFGDGVRLSSTGGCAAFTGMSAHTLK